MHELGILIQSAKTVHGIIKKKGIKQVKHITLEVGDISGVVPMYMKRLFPVAADMYPFLKDAELRIFMAPGDGLKIKDIGY